MGYIKGVFEELRRVTWPSFNEVNRYTWTVLMTVVLFGIFFGIVDLGFSTLINWFLSL